MMLAERINAECLPIKVLLLTTSFPVHRGARSGVFIRRMIDNVPHVIEITVLTPDSISSERTEATAFSIIRFRYAPKNWQRLAHGSGGIMAALSQKKFFFLLLPPLLLSCFISSCWYSRQVDVLHANWSINGVIAGIVGRLLKKPVITTLRGSDVNLMKKSWLMRQVLHACLHLSQQIVTVSPSLQKTIHAQFPRYSSKVVVITNGIDQAFFVAGKNKNLIPEQEQPVRFLYVGNLIAGKGVHLILEAAASLPMDNWYVDVVGDGMEKKKLKAYCQGTILESKIIFHGSVAPEQIPQFMGKADIFILASFAEGRPNVVLEAMAACLPVIATAIPAVEDFVQDGKQGLLFPSGDIEKLAEHMAYLINHPLERRMMGENGKKNLEALNLSWQEAGKQYAAIYTNLIINETAPQ
ncbi:MAG: glycosyltransferase family 4 protein [Candidatus Electrothrix sp. AR3]|nr:glycosyltransferase family 4 protein [Candidatus Electrothrix sp. AR3]